MQGFSNGWETISPDLRERIEKGVPAIRRINRHETFQDWLAVGEALAAMQTAALRLSGSEVPTGRGYNAAYAVIAEQVPDLAAIHKTTRSHAIWMANNAEAIKAWHERLTANIRQQVNHPTTIRRRYEREVGRDEGEQPRRRSDRARQARTAAAALEEARDRMGYTQERLDDVVSDFERVTGRSRQFDLSNQDLIWDSARNFFDIYNDPDNDKAVTDFALALLHIAVGRGLRYPMELRHKLGDLGMEVDDLVRERQAQAAARRAAAETPETAATPAPALLEYHADEPTEAEPVADAPAETPQRIILRRPTE